MFESLRKTFQYCVRILNTNCTFRREFSSTRPTLYETCIFHSLYMINSRYFSRILSRTDFPLEIAGKTFFPGSPSLVRFSFPTGAYQVAI